MPKAQFCKSFVNNDEGLWDRERLLLSVFVRVGISPAALRAFRGVSTSGWQRNSVFPPARR